MSASLKLPTPSLRTQRLWLRGMELSDASDVFAYAREPAVLRYTTGRTPLDVSETEAYLRDSLSDPTNYCWAIRERAEGPVIGAIDLGLQLPDVGRIDYALAATHWGRGLTTEAVRAVSDWAFAAFPTIARLRSAVVVDNIASWRVLEKCGFARVAETMEQWAKQLEPVHLWHYERTKQSSAALGSR